MSSWVLRRNLIDKSGWTIEDSSFEIIHNQSGILPKRMHLLTLGWKFVLYFVLEAPSFGLLKKKIKRFDWSIIFFSLCLVLGLYLYYICVETNSMKLTSKCSSLRSRVPFLVCLYMRVSNKFLFLHLSNWSIPHKVLLEKLSTKVGAEQKYQWHKQQHIMLLISYTQQVQIVCLLSLMQDLYVSIHVYSMVFYSGRIKVLLLQVFFRLWRGCLSFVAI